MGAHCYQTTNWLDRAPGSTGKHMLVLWVLEMSVGGLKYGHWMSSLPHQHNHQIQGKIRCYEPNNSPSKLYGTHS